jgi:hypothetical protein
MEAAILITAIAALITSIVTMLTVNEMKKQRIISHKPILKIESNSFKLVINNHGEWLWEDYKVLQIFNFGSGVAIDIVIDWSIDEDKILQLLKRYDPYNQKDFGKKGQFLSLGNSMHNIEIQKNQKISAIPAFNNSNTSSKINIPSYFIDGFSQYVEDAIITRPKQNKASEELKTLDFEDYIPAIIKIKYKDINNNFYNNEFKLSIGMASIKGPKDEENGSAFLYFTIKEIVYRDRDAHC